jgi:hypothetical protein
LPSVVFVVAVVAVVVRSFATNQSPLHFFSQESGTARAMNKITLGIKRDGRRKRNYQTII